MFRQRPLFWKCVCYGEIVQFERIQSLPVLDVKINVLTLQQQTSHLEVSHIQTPTCNDELKMAFCAVGCAPPPDVYSTCAVLSIRSLDHASWRLPAHSWSVWTPSLLCSKWQHSAMQSCLWRSVCSGRIAFDPSFSAAAVSIDFVALIRLVLIMAHPVLQVQ